MENIIATRRYVASQGHEVVIRIGRPRLRDDNSGPSVAEVDLAGLDGPPHQESRGSDPVPALTAALVLADTLMLSSVLPPAASPQPAEPSPTASDDEPVASRRYLDPEGNEVVLSIARPRPYPKDPEYCSAVVAMTGPGNLYEATAPIVSADEVSALRSAHLLLDALVMSHRLRYSGDHSE